MLDKQNLAASRIVLGNGIHDDIMDIIYVIPERFEMKHSREMVPELEKLNSRMVAEGRSYLLIVIGRLGSSDPRGGIPINWGQISGTRVIIETSRERTHFGMSQGSHYFHNLTSLGVSYFSIPHQDEFQVDWDWMSKQRIVTEKNFVRHIRLETPLIVKVDGRTGMGVIKKTKGDQYYGKA